MELRHLEFFVAVAEVGSIHGAARRLSLAQPSISQAVRSLERHVGTPLLVRSHRGITLTEAGETLFDRARDILDQLDKALEETRGRPCVRKSLNIGLVAGRLAAAELTSSIVTTFRRQHPEIDIAVTELTFSDQVEAVATGQVDVAIVRPPYGDDRIELSPLFSEPRLLCFGAEHPFAAAEVVDAEAFLDEPVVNLNKAPREWAEFWQLNDMRNGAARTLDDPSVTVSELQMTLAAERCVVSVASSGWRMGIANPFLRAAPMEGVAPALVAVGVPRAARTTESDAFVRCARQVTQELLESVPGAELVDQELPA